MYVITYRFLIKSFYFKLVKSMSSESNRNAKIAIFQMNVQNNKENNFKQFLDLYKNIVSSKIKMIFLPEAFDYIGESIEQTKNLAESVDGLVVSRFKQFAKDNNIWISLGGFHESNANGELFNSHLLINDSGNLISKYRKIHLFDISIPDKKFSSLESSYTHPGSQIVEPVPTPIGNIGLSVCYDLRFPEVGSVLRNLGADVLTYPSAFSVHTGPFHWHTLLRARAIETQCYVVAAAQVGMHNKKRDSYGHSMVVDPWGKIIAEGLTNGPEVVQAEIDLNYLEQCRKNMPVIEHRRPDIYLAIRPLDSGKDFKFEKNIINNSVIFFETEFSFAFVNRKPVLPGHVLISSIRPVARFCQLHSSEISDLFQSVRKVSEILEQKYSASALTIAIQDGPEAGQTVSHVHVHILPRKKNDFQNNDDLYKELEKHDKLECQFRTMEEMVQEAKELKELFY